MTALTSDRNTPRAQGDMRRGDVAAGVKIYAGALVVRTAAGTLSPGTTTAGVVGVGRANMQVDNSGGTAGAKTCTYEVGIFRYANSAGTDLITKAQIGDVCYIVDDQTVAKTNATNTRSKAGYINDVDTLGVWLRLDEALTNAS